MGRPLRVKHCDRCQEIASVLYRIQYDESGEWIFVCDSEALLQSADSCWSSLSQNNPHYVYGGTWKAKKKS